ncbi:MAG: DUF3866 family protein [Syntrophaceticus sp.]|nr:DUF3866 family protein [Syntrophaceticus sp.]MDD3315075.1 DUF3866 family protein [Syntrophaceticus sp.]MDD4359756.1 DUF3866 family protein [Syntrophaceticus sp.]MDD4782766.1 DUF3866 family protein [Syntrophaceticus sp.]HBI26653.1 DUF3866 domain-containing protein [Peptococcaceae bacterium]
MISWKKGKVKRVLNSAKDIQELEVEVDGLPGRAWNYPLLTGEALSNDHVYLNTTAVEKGLGSGGYHFVIANLSRIPDPCPGDGHIMKLRYTPYQVKVLSVEEEASPYHRQIKDFTSLQGIPVIVGTLHSMLAPAAAGCLAAGASPRIAYVMTDGAALPLSLSKMVRTLKAKGMLVGTVSTGDAFGGDLESVNIYSGLIAAYQVLKAEIIIVTMGPGIVGTGTKWGTTAVEQGEVINAVSVLGGQPIAVPRISFADPRPRHQGISHHTITALGQVALRDSILALPEVGDEQREVIDKQLEESDILSHHQVVVKDGRPALQYLEEQGIAVKSMGRTPQDDPVFFLAAGAAGAAAAELK